jgi:hypothetical protein
MSCALRCKTVSPSKLDDPRTCGLRSESIHSATTSACGVRGLATVTPIVLIPPSRSTFGETLVTLILGRSATTTHGSLSYVAGSPCGAGSRRA